jgi:hypothetical protein
VVSPAHWCVYTELHGVTFKWFLRHTGVYIPNYLASHSSVVLSLTINCHLYVSMNYSVPQAHEGAEKYTFSGFHDGC